jgi:glycosyltransferase involved in cell wall biosynthesis
VRIPRVSVVTPTWDRRDYLFDRCLPSVRAQTWADTEHVVVVDGPDDGLAARLAEIASDGLGALTYDCLPAHDPGARWGHWARLRGIELATGEFITYLDDDDSYRPQHCQLLAEALMAHPDADFAYSMMCSQGAVIGQDPPVYCQIGTPMIMHRRRVLELGTWEQSFPSIDWDLVERWLVAGAKYVHVPTITVDVWPSAFR